MECGRWMFWTGGKLQPAAVGLSLTICLCLNLCAGQALGQATATDKPASKVKLESTGLALATSQAAFFSSSMNLRQDMIDEYESGWIGTLRKVPYVQDLEAYLKEKWNDPDPQVRQVKSFLTGRIARDILALLSDMVAKECFIIGEESWVKFVESFADLQYEIAALDNEDPDAMREHFLSMTKEELDAIPVPTTIIGFQLSEDANARSQLDQLEGILQLALSQAPELKPLAKQLKHADLKNGQMLTMTFDAKDIPWETIPAPNADAEEILDHIADLLEGRKIVISLGVLDNRLMLSISENANTLTELGKAASLLTTASLKQLVDNQPDHLRSVQFSSGAFRDAAMQVNFGNYFQRIALQATTPMQAQFDSEEFEAWQDKLLEDCEWLDDRVAEMLPEFKDTLAYAYQSPDGLESLMYDWTPNWLLENAKPLAVTRHGGTGPLILLAMRQKWLKQPAEIMDAIVEALPEHVKMIAEAGIMDEDDAEEFLGVAGKVVPIITKMFKAVHQKLCAGMDQNESLLSITAQTTATQLSEDAPPPPAPLPLPEVAWAVKLKNKDLFLSGCDEIISSINDIIDLMREANPAVVSPGAKIPEPRDESLPDGGKRYWFAMGAPPPWDQFEIQMAINKDVAVFGYSSRQVKDMYADRPLAARPAWYSEDEPIASVGFIDVAGMFTALKPWVHYGIASGTDDMDAPLGPEMEDGPPVPSGNDILQIWDCFKQLGKAAGTTVVDNQGVAVSHWIWVRE